MAIPLIVNGVTFQYPSQFDKNWGPTLTNWSTAVTVGMLQKAGGAFTLTAETDFGASFGLKTLYIKSKDANIAATGFLRLGNASAGVVWRNAANNADLALTVNASNQLTFNGVNVGATTSLTNAHILVGNVSNQPADVAMSGDITITNAGVTAIGTGKVLDANVGSAAAIQLSKLAALSNSQLVVSNGSGVLVSQASPSLTELGYVAGVGSAIQTQINGLVPLAGGTWTGNMNAGGKKITALAVGTASGDSVAFQQLTIPLTVTSTKGSIDGATTIITKSITTTGGNVLILASASLQPSGATNPISISAYVTRAGTSVPGGEYISKIPSTGAASVSFTASILALDSPAAGTYTYRFTYDSNGALTLLDYSLTTIELHA